MRRGLVLVSLLLVLLGLELSTEAVTLVAERFVEGISALLGRTESGLPGFRFVGGLVALASGMGLWILLGWSARRRGAVGAEGDACPQCGGETRRVRRRGWQRLLGALLGERTTRRKCGTCGWVGLSVRR
jgi:hypothetical protein